MHRLDAIARAGLAVSPQPWSRPWFAWRWRERLCVAYFVSVGPSFLEQSAPGRQGRARSSLTPSRDIPERWRSEATHWLNSSPWPHFGGATQA